MKKKTGIYLVIGIIGIALALSARFLLQDCLSDSQSGAMIGIGAGLFGYGIAKWCVGLWGAKNFDLLITHYIIILSVRQHENKYVVFRKVVLSNRSGEPAVKWSPMVPL